MSTDEERLVELHGRILRRINRSTRHMVIATYLIVAPALLALNSIVVDRATPPWVTVLAGVVIGICAFLLGGINASRWRAMLMHDWREFVIRLERLNNA